MDECLEVAGRGKIVNQTFGKKNICEKLKASNQPRSAIIGVGSPISKRSTADYEEGDEAEQRQLTFIVSSPVGQQDQNDIDIDIFGDSPINLGFDLAYKYAKSNPRLIRLSPNISIEHSSNSSANQLRLDIDIDINYFKNRRTVARVKHVKNLKTFTG